MNKSQFVKELGSRTGYSKAELINLLNVGLDILRERLLLGDTVHIWRFGTFSLKKLSGGYKKNYYNVNTGEAEGRYIESRDLVKFKMSPEFLNTSLPVDMNEGK